MPFLEQTCCLNVYITVYKFSRLFAGLRRAEEDMVRGACKCVFMEWEGSWSVFVRGVPASSPKGKQTRERRHPALSQANLRTWALDSGDQQQE